MTYDLCKKLEKAGYKFKDFTVDEYLHLDKEDGGWTKPSLSELIEVCGDNFDSIAMCSDKYSKWIIYGNDDDQNQVVIRSSTPEEGVANLWLSLKKNG